MPTTTHLETIRTNFPIYTIFYIIYFSPYTYNSIPYPHPSRGYPNLLYCYVLMCFINHSIIFLCSENMYTLKFKKFKFPMTERLC